MVGAPAESAAGEGPDPLPVDDRFFLHIALKNQLLSEEQARQASRWAVEQRLRLEEALLKLNLLDDRQVRRVREAIAASQVVRLDSIYADVALAAGLASRAVIDEAFGEQRRQRFRVRLGNLLVERGHLAPDQHRRVITQVIKRLKKLGPEAYSGSDMGRLSPAPPPPPPDAPPPVLAIQLDETIQDEGDEIEQSLRSDSGLLASNLRRLESAALPAKLDETIDAPPPTAPHADDGLVADALRAGLRSSGADALALSRTDERVLEEDLRLASDEGRPGQDDLLRRLGTPSGEPSGEGAFDPEAWVQRKRKKRRVLLLAVALPGLILGTAAIALFLSVWSNRRRLEAAVAQVSAAEGVTDLAERLRRLQEAEDLLVGLGSLGLPPDASEAVRGDVRWLRLEAEARAALQAGKPGEAAIRLQGVEASVPPGRREAARALLREAGRQEQVRLGELAEGRLDWAAAVLAYRAAMELGDPGGQAGIRLLGVKRTLVEEMDQAYRRATESPGEAEEAEFSRAAKRIQDLFNEDPGTPERLRALAGRRALAAASADYERGDLETAERALEEARRRGPDSREVADLQERIQRRRELRAAEAEARAAEEKQSWPAARAAWVRAINLASDEAERERFRAGMARADAAEAQLSRKAQVEELRETALVALRTSRAADARTALERLVGLDREDAAARALLELATKVEGMVYIPPGQFLMGGGTGARPLESPQRQVTTGGYFIDRTEVTNEAWAAWLETSRVAPPGHWTQRDVRPEGVRLTYSPGLARHPVVNVTWTQARDFAAWRGGVLPSEAQWEKAARGTDGRTWPWGEKTRARAHVQVPGSAREYDTSPVGVQADDKSPWGVMDLAGNVSEWTRDPLRPYPDAPPDARAPNEPRRVLRGGTFATSFAEARCAARGGASEDYKKADVGFRVVVEVPDGLAAELEKRQ